jgi:hypothetical protein
MSSKASNWTVAVGALCLFFGLCVLPAALADRSDASLLGMGASLFSLGALVTAAGIYMKARTLASEAGSQPAPAKRRVRGGCGLCGTEAPVIQCKVHQLQLCGECLAEHYDFRSCAYVPTTRRPTSKGGKAMAAKARGV